MILPALKDETMKSAQFQKHIFVFLESRNVLYSIKK